MFGSKKGKGKAVGLSFKPNPEFETEFIPPEKLPSNRNTRFSSPPVSPTASSPSSSPPVSPNGLAKLSFKDDENDTILNEEYAIENGDDRRRSSGMHSDISEEPEPPLNRFTRRKSVFAEAYDPEEDDDDGERVIHAKSDEQRQRLAETVKHIFLFRSLDPDQMSEVLDAMFERRVTDSEYVIKQGDDGDNFYVVDSGTYDVFVKMDGEAEPKKVMNYDNQGSFGELALMYNLPRAATVQATSAGVLWAMERQTFRRILLKSACKKRKLYMDLLEKVPMLKSLERYERMNLADALVPRMFEEDETIISQGAPADGMFFLEEGNVRITMRNSNNEEKEITRIACGGYFGELGLITNKPRAASAFAVGKTRLAVLDVDAFERLLGPCMDLMKRNIDNYENELLRIFGSKANISDIR